MSTRRFTPPLPCNPKLSQHGNAIAIICEFRDAYEAAIVFDDIATKLEDNGNVTLKLKAKAWKRSRTILREQPWWRHWIERTQRKS
jgi:hypothetical protein